MHSSPRLKVIIAHPLLVLVTIVGTLVTNGVLVTTVAASSSGRDFYHQKNLVSDLPGVAKHQDPNLVNAWGLSHSPTGPWMVSDNGSRMATQYKSNGKGVPPAITIPLPGGGPGGAATGNVFNGTSDFVVSQGSASGPSQFLFATEDGTISGWNPNVDATHAISSPHGLESASGTLDLNQRLKQRKGRTLIDGKEL